MRSLRNLRRSLTRSEDVMVLVRVLVFGENLNLPSNIVKAHVSYPEEKTGCLGNEDREVQDVRYA